MYGPLLRAGIQILEFNRTMLHHKTMVVDGVWSTIGTTNFDNRSFAHNEENNICVYDAGHAATLQAVFRADLEGCDRIDYASWRRRGPLQRVGEVIAAFLTEQV
jgi:cardiolipin synthase